MTIRRQLTASYVVILSLLSANLLIQLWTNGKRACASDDLQRAMSRQNLIHSIQEQIGARQKQVTFLSQLEVDRLSASADKELNDQLDALQEQVQQLEALADPGDPTRIREFGKEFAELTASWRLFYKRLGDDQALAIDELQVHGEPRAQTILQWTLPRIALAEKNRQEAAAANFNDVTTLASRLTIVVLLISSALAVLIAVIVSRRLQQGLRVLKVGANAIAAGDLKHEIPTVGHHDELVDLAAAFNRMSGSLQVAQSEISKRQHDLELLSEEAESANRAKSQFLANMSHELRTPMNAVIGYSEMLIEEAEDLCLDQFVPDLKKIRTAGLQLLELINDILDLSKIEAGKVELHFEEFDIASMIHDVTEVSQPLAAKNDNAIVARVDDNVGTMSSDVTRVRQILFNLLSNACKFTRAGSVELIVSRVSAPAGDQITFQVRDSGIGMSPEQISRVFEAFTQADASTTRKYGGTGLGLAITKKFCELLSGGIAVESELGKGATFSVRLPVRQPGPTHAATQPARMGYGPSANGSVPFSKGAGHVLVIEGDPAMQNVTRSFLTRMGYIVSVAGSGEEGLRLAREVQPDVITLDIAQPELDGWNLLSALKRDAGLRDIPVMVLTMSDAINRGYALGASEFLTKPIDGARLTTVLQKYRRPDNRRVLVVDDDSEVRDYLKRALQNEGWTVEIAENGRVALDTFADFDPCVILLDLMMPELDGFGFIEEFRTLPTSLNVPVVVLTAKDLTTQDRDRLNGRVARILAKGQGTDAVLTTVLEFVSQRSAKAEPVPVGCAE